MLLRKASLWAEVAPIGWTEMTPPDFFYFSCVIKFFKIAVPLVIRGGVGVPLVMGEGTFPESIRSFRKNCP